MEQKQSQKTISDDGRMSLGGHLSEFRSRLVVCVVVLVVAFLVCMTQARAFSELLISRATMFTFVYTAPTELFLVYMRLALIGALLIDIPVIIYEVWSFMKPGLLDNEKKALKVVFTFGLLLFVIGAVFAFFVILPISTRFFYGLNMGELIRPMISIESYVAYVTQIMLAFGAVFELPIVVVMLTNLGILHMDFLRKNRKIVIVAVFFLAAVITPPDVTSQILVALPMLLLFEISIFLGSSIEKRKKAKEEEEETADEEDETADKQEGEGRRIL